jgi:putative heme-binding domain-containing protein
MRRFFRASISVGLIAILCGAGAFGKTPDRGVIEKFRDRTIYLHGRFAAVKLPITNGVKVWNPAAIACSPEGVVFVANFTGEICTLHDSDGDGLEDTATLYADVRKDGLRYPTSLAFRGRELFVATTQEIRVYTDTDGDGVADQSRAFFRDFPFTLHRFDWTFGLCFDREGSLFFNLSTDAYSPTPAADPKGWRGSILRLSPDGQQVERFATGLRFSYGMAFNPEGDLFFTDNRGGENPVEELNVAVRGGFFGQNPSKFPGHPRARTALLSVRYGVAPTALAFNAPGNEFGATGGDLFMACWGPDWHFNRGSIVRVRLLRQPGGEYRAQEFLFAHEVPKVTALAFGANGDLYATLFGREAPGHQPSPKADGAIYRFIPAAWVEPGAAIRSEYPFVKGDTAAGGKIFEERGCAACHTLDGRDEMLGPDLNGLGEIYSAAEVLNLIRNPSESIKSGHETQEVTTTDGEVLLGRMKGSSAEEIALVTVGNRLIRVPRSKIASERTLPTSLMPEGLLNGLSEKQTNDLLAYLGVRDREPTWIVGQWRKVEAVLRSFAPQISLKVKLAVIAALGVVFVAAVRAWRRRRRAR